MSRRAWIAIAACLAALLALTRAYPAFPTLFAWLVSGCVLGSIVALAPRSTSHPGDRVLALLRLYSFLVGVALLGTFVAARSRTQSMHLRYAGVRIAKAASVAIGADEDSLDISLDPAAGARGWRLRLQRTRGSWITSIEHPPEELFAVRYPDGWLANLIARRFGVRYLEPLSGQALGIGEQGRPLLIPAGAVQSGAATAMPVSIVATDSGTEVHIGASAWRVSPDRGPAAYRNPILLRRGAYLSEFTAVGAAAPAPIADFVRIRELRPGERVGDRYSFGALIRTIVGRAVVTEQRFLVSVTAPLSFAAAPSAAGFVPTDRTTEIIARVGGNEWQFGLRADTSGIDVDFIRRPRRRDLPLVAAGACPAGAACNVASLRRFPPPAPELLLSEGGLDSTRFALFGRFYSDPSSVWFVRDSARIPISSGSEGTWLPAVTIRPSAGDPVVAAVRVAAVRGIIGAARDVFLIAAGVFLLLTALYRIVRSAVARQHAVVGSVAERPLALAMNGFLALASARLILGLRVTLFAPYEPRGIETALGMWVALGTAIAVLLRWRAWFPVVVEWYQVGIVQVIRKAWPRFSFGRSVQRLLQSGWKSPEASVLVAYIIWALVAKTAWPIMFGVFIGCATAAIWASLALAVGTMRGIRTPAAAQCLDGPWGALEADLQLPPDRARWSYLARPLVTVSLLAFTVVLPGIFLVAVAAYVTASMLVAVSGMILVAFHVRVPVRTTWITQSAPRLRAVLLAGAPIALLAVSAESRSAASLGLALCVCLVGLRVGASLFQQAAESLRRPGSRQFILPLAGAVIPFVLLLPLLLIDWGLFLIVVIPIVAAVYLAAGVFRGPAFQAWFAAALLAAFVGVLGWRLRAFPVEQLLTASNTVVNQRVTEMQSFLGLERLPKFQHSLANVAARGLAARSQPAAERVLAIAGPSLTREFLPRAIEQTWGTGAYAAAGWRGVGLGESVIGGRGVAEAVSYAENSYSVFVLSEHGLLGGLAILLCYGLVVAGTVAMLVRRRSLVIGRFNSSIRTLLFLGVALLVLPACYVALANVGALPITGQNMPFLGLNGWSDVLFCTGVASFFAVAAFRLNAEAAALITLEAPDA